MEENSMPQPVGKWRRISAWIMLALFVLLIFNILFFHILPGESAVMYVGLIVVFFLGNGMRGGVQPYGQQGQQEQQGQQDGLELEGGDNVIESESVGDEHGGDEPGGNKPGGADSHRQTNK